MKRAVGKPASLGDPRRRQQLQVLQLIEHFHSPDPTFGRLRLNQLLAPTDCVTYNYKIRPRVNECLLGLRPGVQLDWTVQVLLHAELCDQ